MSSARIKESTASAFLFRPCPDEWRLGLIWHPRLECWMLAGGHVETFENAAEAVQREISEETGWRARLIFGPSNALPAGAPHPLVPAPWWVQELDVHPDNHTRGPHVHIDHLFLAVAEGDGPVSEAAHEVRWFTAAEIAEHGDISEDLRPQAKDLFGRIGEITEPGRRPALEGIGSR
ncbi:NUDIX domain-containing protein [Streptomyces prunicolor]|uniref:NUDIX domain-containing protein n=1 Tax=Streptomyces prunicolor TaxID=67348 RepID=UPI00037C84FF|nr:NUDIX domain-containing protein [Streptomyces prunicolor]